MSLPSISLTHAAIWLLSHSSLGLSAVASQSPLAALPPQSPRSGPGVPPTESAACQPSGHRLMPRGGGASKCLGLGADKKTRHVSTTFSIQQTIGQEQETRHEDAGITFLLSQGNDRYHLRLSITPPPQGQGRRTRPMMLDNLYASIHRGERPPPERDPINTIPLNQAVSLISGQLLEISIPGQRWQQIVVGTTPDQVYMTVWFDKMYARRLSPATIQP